jgi:hypothetical protein
MVALFWAELSAFSTFFGAIFFHVQGYHNSFEGGIILGQLRAFSPFFGALFFLLSLNTKYLSS